MRLEQKKYCPFCNEWKIENRQNFKPARRKCRACYNADARIYQAKHQKKPDVKKSRNEYMKKRYRIPEIRKKALEYQKKYWKRKRET